MKNVKLHFEQNIIRVKNLGLIYNTIGTSSTLDLSDILRAQYVMLVSALDHFIHELVKFGMLEIYNGNRKVTKKFKQFILSTDKDILFQKAIMEEKNDVWIDYQIRHRNGFKSFQEAEKIKEAISLIIDTNIWEEITTNSESGFQQIKRKLNLIIDRRNQISHEADIEPTYQELRTIYIDDVKDSILFIESLINRIYNFCNNT